MTTVADGLASVEFVQTGLGLSAERRCGCCGVLPLVLGSPLSVSGFPGCPCSSTTRSWSRSIYPRVMPIVKLTSSPLTPSSFRSSATKAPPHGPSQAAPTWNAHRDYKGG